MLNRMKLNFATLTFIDYSYANQKWVISSYDKNFTYIHYKAVEELTDELFKGADVDKC